MQKTNTASPNSAITDLPNGKTTADNNICFEEALQELDVIVNRLEKGQISLEDSIAAFERGSCLLKSCQAQLQVAEQRLNIFESQPEQEHV